MKMSKISLIAALAAGALIAFTPTLRAADQPERPNRPERGPRVGQAGDRLKEIAEKLDLTADQKTKLQEAMKAQRAARPDLKDATPEERRAAMKKSREAMDAKVKEILTPEQYTKWEKLRQEIRPGGPNGKRRGPGGPPAE